MSDSQNTSSGGLGGSESSPRKSENQIDGQNIARLFKYYAQFKNPFLRYPVPLNRVAARETYAKHKRVFDVFAVVSSKYGIDSHAYIKFFVNDMSKSERDIDTEFISRVTLEAFVTKGLAVEKRQKVYGWIVKSAENLARYCVDNDFVSARDGMNDLMRRGKIASWYVSGMMSRYFLCAIPNFIEIVPKFGRHSQDDMRDLVSKFDIYNTEANEAFLYMKNRRANPMALADDEIFKLKATKKDQPSLMDDELFDDSL